MGAAGIPLSLYIHLPWCMQKCPYCDFNSHKAGDAPPRQRYVDTLAADIRAESERAAGRVIDTVYLGGGTPSIFPPAEIGAILNHCRREFTLADDCEITMEANPGTVERGSLLAYREAGVNRLSIGAQSFGEHSLRLLGRIHGPGDIRDAYAEASRAGFDSINVDLMFALPMQDLEGAKTDVEALLELAPAHVSYYQLTLEPNTVFHERPPEGLPGDDLAWEIQEQGHALLEAAGFEHYEVSAFARPGHRCRHNLNYWTFGDYLAVGAGAHGKITGEGCVVQRYSKPANPLSYMESAGRAGAVGEPLDVADLGFEFMLNALRLIDGFPAKMIAERIGADPPGLWSRIEEARRDGLLEVTESGTICPTPRGFRFLNDRRQAGFFYAQLAADAYFFCVISALSQPSHPETLVTY
jgi:oxygen-independent coproporphyrinogen-3 oxidase